MSSKNLPTEKTKLEQLPNGDFVDFDEVVAVQLSEAVPVFGCGPSVTVTGRGRSFVSVIRIDPSLADGREQAERIRREIADRINARRDT